MQAWSASEGNPRLPLRLRFRLAPRRELFGYNGSTALAWPPARQTMCGRFTLRAPVSVLAEQFALLETAPLAPRFNIAPTQPVAIVRLRPATMHGDRPDARGEGRGNATASLGLDFGSKERQMVLVRWGLIPSWAKDPRIGSRMINARAESAAEKPAFRAALARRRCLMLADGFYEWQQTGKGKRAHFIRMRDDRPFAFAAIWEAWKAPDGCWLESAALLTTEANEVVAPIHDRMPVILRPEDYASWLDPGRQGPESLRPLLRPYAADAMVAYPVSTHVNSPAHDDARCIQPDAQGPGGPHAV